MKKLAGRLRILGLLLALCLLAGIRITGAFAATSTEARIAVANANTVGVISGGVDGTYIRIASDFSAVLDSGDQLRVLTIVGKGSLQNIADLLYLKGIDIGIVQSDVLAYAKQNQLYPGLEKSVQYICKLYDEEVHILAARDIATLQDLAGKKVNVDGRGSGTAMTTSVLFQGLGIKVDPTYDDDQSALEKLKRGEISALVYVTGKPARLFTGISADSGLHFLSVPLNQGLVETYLPAELDHAAYPSLVPDDKPVSTIAVGSVLAVFGWPPHTDRYARVTRFIDAFFANFQQFLHPPRHPKWREVNLAAEVPGWTRFAPAQAALDRLPPIATSSEAQRVEFTTFLSQANVAPARMTQAQEQTLFQQFLDWQRQRNRSASR